MVIDWGGQVFPYDQPPPIGSINYTLTTPPPDWNPDRTGWGQGTGGGFGPFGGFLGNILNPVLNKIASPEGVALAAALMVAPEIAPALAETVPEATALAESTPVAEGASVADTGLSMIPPETPVDIPTPNVVDTGLSMTPPDTPVDLGTAQLGSGTSLSADASTNALNPFYNVANPEVQANLGTVSNLVGGGAESNLATLDSLSNPLLPTTGTGIGGSELGATGSIVGSGQGLGVQTLPETTTGLNGLTPNDLMSQPTNIPNPSVTISDVADAAKTAKNIANLLKTNTSAIGQLQKNAQVNNQISALSNLLRAGQVQGLKAPPIYKMGNPFTFSPEEPTTLANLLRNNYGNS